MTAAGDGVFDDLEAEQGRIEDLLDGLDAAAWAAPSAAAGWSVSDVVLHLAQTEEAVSASVDGIPLTDTLPLVGSTMDEVMDNLVAAQRTDPSSTFARWRMARRAALAKLRAADPNRRLPWADAPLKPAALATTRLAEHWAHALDITDALDLPFPDTDRIRHIAWLAHRSLPYGFTYAGLEPHDVYCELTAPDGVSNWTFGAESADSRITGPAGAFSRVGAQRLPAAGSGLVATGPHGGTALTVLRNYAG
jgi:uncharacterized protein (TIGR03084 family)